MIFSYANDGSRVPFNPSGMSGQLAGCLLCGAPVAMVGVFIPMTAKMEAVVLRLRKRSVRSCSTPCLSYGLCHHHLIDPTVTDLVETVLVAAAEQVVVQ